MEQLNIEGKRSGDGFVANRVRLINGLSRSVADRIKVAKLTVGRKGFANYLKALNGNIVKVIPSNSDKFLKVTCGATESQIQDGQWITDDTPMTFVEVKVCPHYSVVPNVGSAEIAEAMARVLPFVAKGEDRPVLSCLYLEAKEGILNIVASDGFRMAVDTVDYADGEGSALIDRDDLKGVIPALRKAKRVRLTFNPPYRPLSNRLAHVGLPPK